MIQGNVEKQQKYNNLKLVGVFCALFLSFITTEDAVRQSSLEPCYCSCF